MGFFNDTIAAALAGTVVRCDLLVFFDFRTTPMRLWPGFGVLHTNDGHDWSGLGELGQIGDLESAIAGGAPQTTFTLSGVDTNLIADAMNQSSEVKGRDVTVYMQFFDADFQCLDNPYAIWTGLMDVMSVKQTGPATCSVELTAESLFARRALPPLGMLTDRDQRRFYPDDSGLSQIALMPHKTVTWPIIKAH